jgi:hypothetical protein
MNERKRLRETLASFLLGFQILARGHPSFRFKGNLTKLYKLFENIFNAFFCRIILK